MSSDPTGAVLAAPEMRPIPNPRQRHLRTRQSSAATSLAAGGEPMIWLAGGALALAVTMIVGLVVLVLYQGMLTFWLDRLVRVELDDGAVHLGEVADRQSYVPSERVLAALPTEAAERARREMAENDGRIWQEKIRVENFDLSNLHFVWVDDVRIKKTTYPEWALVIERLTNGRFYGVPAAFLVDGQPVASVPAEAWDKFVEYQPEVHRRWVEQQHLERDDMRAVGRRMTAARLAVTQAELDQGIESAEYTKAKEALAETEQWETTETARIFDKLAELGKENARYQLQMTTAQDQTALLPLENIVRAYPANQLGWWGKLGVYLSRWWEFLTTGPREANSEGGVFPAIFGTVAMTLIMSVAVVPFGVLAALYLREYAKPGPIVSAVRIAINNLAGVPSIVFGVFGLGFFCYGVGASIDRMFFAAALAEGHSTYGTGGIFWASLTLALLTLPVVIVTTEEALAAVPSSMREGSYACGASKWQTIHRIVLPRAMPGIMTGMILAMARGAGEVAPLMLVGAMKLVPELPIDGTFPFIHPERSFMHLGYQIFDLAFHSQNSVAAASMLFTTTLLLVTIVATLNIAAIWLRGRLRRRFHTSHF